MLAEVVHSVADFANQVFHSLLTVLELNCNVLRSCFMFNEDYCLMSAKRLILVDTVGTSCLWSE